jgi:glutathione S-transferase
MIELWQTEWCPASRRIRQRLTELEVDYLIHQVPVDRAERSALIAATGANAVPAMVLGDGTVLADEAAIRDWLDASFREPDDAVAHRDKAAHARARECREAAMSEVAR